jgi:hypothetical protein
MPEPPVVFLAFANAHDQGRYLPRLDEEGRRLQEMLEGAERQGLCELVFRAAATDPGIREVFNQYRDRVAIFHYGGHADGARLLLDSPSGVEAPADAGGFAAFLGQRRGLQLVFLNGCSTRAQVTRLLAANVAAVIATSRAIEDGSATEFACAFYRELVAGANVKSAYLAARGAVLMSRGANRRDLYAVGKSNDKLVALAGLPWKLAIRPGAEAVKLWNLHDAADKPLLALPRVSLPTLPRPPYRHLLWYTREYAEVFFGRGYDIRKLYDLIHSPARAPIVLYYGQTGVGKSSVLEAGVLPRLEANREVLYRVRYARRDQARGLLGTLARELAGDAGALDLAKCWRDYETREKARLVLILDQVEEAFTRPRGDPAGELEELLQALAATFAERSGWPSGKIVLSFRKEYLPEIEQALTRHKLWPDRMLLEAMDERGIIEAIEGPTREPRLRQQYGLTVEDGLARHIAGELLADRGAVVAPTLQVLLYKMWERARKADTDHPRYTLALYQALKREGLLLKDFLDQQLAALREWRAEVVDSGLALDFLTYHTTNFATSEQHTAAEREREYGHRRDVLQDLVGRCRDLYLLTSPQGTPDGNTRLAHDTLAPLVRARFDTSVTTGQRARRILESRAREWGEGKTGATLDGADLATVEAGAAGMRDQTKDEKRLIQASREKRKFRRLIQGGTILALAAAVAAVFFSSLDAARKGRLAEERLADGYLLTIGHDARNIAPIELKTFWTLASEPNERVRFLFLKNALQDPEKARQVRNRLEIAVHAAVGLDPGLRRRVRNEILAPVFANPGDLEITLLASEILVELDAAALDGDAALAGRVTRALLDGLPATTDPVTLYGLRRTFERIAPNLTESAAVETAGKIREVLPRLTTSNQIATLTQSLKAISPKLSGPAFRRVAAETVEPIMDRYAVSDRELDRWAMARSIEPLLPELSEAIPAKLLELLVNPPFASKYSDKTRALLDLLVARLDEGAAAKMFERAVRIFGDRPERPFAGRAALTAISEPLAKRLASPAATNLAQKLLTDVPQAKAPERLEILALALKALSPQLEAKQFAAAAEAVAKRVDELAGESQDPAWLESLSGSLQAVSSGLGRDTARRGAEAIAEQLTRFLDSKPSAKSFTATRQAVQALAPSLEEVTARRLASALLREMPRQLQDPYSFIKLAEAFQALSPRLGKEPLPDADSTVQRLLDSIPTIREDVFFGSPVRAIWVLAPRLGNARATKAAESVLDLIAKHKQDDKQLEALVQVFEALTGGLEPSDFAEITRKSLDVLRKAKKGYTLSSLTRALKGRLPELEKGTADQVATVVAERIIDLAPATKELYDLDQLTTALESIAFERALRDKNGAEGKTREAAAKIAGKAIEQTKAARAFDFETLSRIAAALSRFLEGQKVSDLATAIARRIQERLNSSPKPFELLDIDKALSPLVPLTDPGLAKQIATTAARKIVDRIPPLGRSFSSADFPKSFASLAALLDAAAATELADRLLLDNAALNLNAERFPPGFEGNEALYLLERLSPFLKPLVPKLTSAELVRLLRYPRCVGSVRRVVLDEIGRRLRPGKAFRNVWDLRAWITAHRSDHADLVAALSAPLPPTPPGR